MRVVGVSRVLNEADVIEPFLRHHAALLDLHIVLDNGSTDGTVEIMRQLAADGLALQVYQTVSAVFLEQAYNTGLYRFALGEGADWVVFLDADELLVLQDADRVADLLALASPDMPCLRMPVFRYARPAPEPGVHALAAARRRQIEPEMHKIVLRRLDPLRVSVSAGNHFAVIDGREDQGLPQARMHLAHVPDRHPTQLARKIILGRLKAIASGQEAANFFSVHRVADFEALKVDPRSWLAGANEPVTMDDPVPYRGGTLRFTADIDEGARFIAVMAAQVETLARSHGDILDAKRLIKQDKFKRGSEARRLF